MSVLPELVYVLGAGHCGSTLLNMMLNRHPTAFGLGEVVNVNSRSSHGARVETLPPDSPWHRIAERYERMAGEGFSSVDLRSPITSSHELFVRRIAPPERWIRQNSLLMRAAAEEVGAQVLVDSSKELPRGWLLRGLGFRAFKVLYLVRDGRAIMNSYHKKYGTWERGYRRLVQLDLKAQVFRRHLGASNWLTVRYEDLATRPEGTVRAICRFAGLSYREEMLDFRGGRYDGVGGNRMRSSGGADVSLDSAWVSSMPLPVRVGSSVALLPYHLVHGYPLVPPSGGA